MKVKRVKGAKKIINFYKNSFGIFEPYQVLIDLTFCQAAILGKVLLKEQIPKYFDAKVQLDIATVTTNCIIEEGKALGPSLNGAVSIASRCQVRLCGHKKSPVPAAECIKSIIGPTNANRYFVATQDRELQTHLESIPGLPLLYLNHNCMVLEKPTPLSYETAQQIQDSKVNPTSLEKKTIQKLKGETESEEKVRRKRKKPGGPNPLSVLKRKRTADKTISHTEKKKRVRKRKKAKVPTHVIQALTEES